MSDNEITTIEGQAVAQVTNSSVELEALTKIVSAIQSLTGSDAQMRVVKSALTLLGWADTFTKSNGAAAPSSVPAAASFSEDRNLSPKEFLLEKKPLTDIERVTCLAYYLTHYRSTPHFKTLDISKLNTEAAQVKFANAANAVENATLAGHLIQAGKGNKQISANGELYVQALPDRDAAKEAIAHARPRRKNKKGGTKGSEDEAKTN